mmetsp:Transcript_7176/g.15259  ORF Transcript_7176/g.15259 Transcript_7176/m.15259 type:complete len:256 (+) Transcript_7176:207-974(+)
MMQTTTPMMATTTPTMSMACGAVSALPTLTFGSAQRFRQTRSMCLWPRAYSVIRMLLTPSLKHTYRTDIVCTAAGLMLVRYLALPVLPVVAWSDCMTSARMTLWSKETSGGLLNTSGSVCPVLGTWNSRVVRISLSDTSSAGAPVSQESCAGAPAFPQRRWKPGSTLPSRTASVLFFRLSLIRTWRCRKDFSPQTFRHVSCIRSALCCSERTAFSIANVTSAVPSRPRQVWRTLMVTFSSEISMFASSSRSRPET